MKLDGGGHHVIERVEDGMLTDHLWGALTVQNGTLYQRTPTELRIRDLETGIVARPPFSVDRNDVSAIGFGSEWLGRNEDRDSIQRVDLVSGAVVGSIDVPGGAPVLAVGPDAVWFVTRTGDLGRLDPVSMQVQRWPSGALKPGAVVPFRDYVWVCDCDNRQIFRFDIATQEFRRFDIPEKAYLLGPTDGSSASQLWLVDEAAGAITELDPVSGQRGRAHGFTGVIADAEIGLGKIWIAAADHVYVLDANDEMTDIPMPPGFFASSVAVDTADETVWIGTCGCPLDEA